VIMGGEAKMLSDIIETVTALDAPLKMAQLWQLGLLGVFVACLTE